MKLDGNTILITGGGSGIGKALAEQFHQRGNQVIITGRRRGVLEKTVAENPGMHFVEMDVTDPSSVHEAAKRIIADFPALNVLINNSGIMQIDDISKTVDDHLATSTINTNLLGTIRVTSAFIEHLKQQPHATVANVSSVLAFIPLAISGVYSATKAALHSYTMSLRYMLGSTSVRVLEIAPPWVQTDLLNSNNEPRAMPLAQFISETMEALATDSDEVLVPVASHIRSAAGPTEMAFVSQFNDSMLSV